MLPAESCCLTPLILDTCSRVIRVLREQYDIVGLTRAISCLFAYSEQYDIVGLTRAISCLFAYSEKYDICCFDTCELVSHRVLCQVRFSCSNTCDLVLPAHSGSSAKSVGQLRSLVERIRDLSVQRVESETAS